MTFNFPKLRGERLIIAALLMILIAECVSTFWQLEKMRSMLESFGFLILMISMITTGVRATRTNWPSFKGITMTVIGLGLCAIPLLSVQAYKKIGKTLDDKPRLERMKAALEKDDVPLKSKIKLSKMYAQNKYLYEGVIVSYLTEAGEQTRYVPTKEDTEFRNLKTTATQQWKDSGKGLSAALWTWTGIATISLLVGVFSPIKKTTPNTGIDADAAG